MTHLSLPSPPKKLTDSTALEIIIFLSSPSESCLQPPESAEQRTEIVSCRFWKEKSTKGLQISSPFCFSLVVSMTFDPDTAHRRLVISRDRKTVTWGMEEQPLSNSDKRFSPRVWVLGQNGFKSGKHCWEVEIKHDGEWAVGVARESVKRKGMTDFSTKEGIWAIAEYWGKANYVAFTEPQPTRLSFRKKPRRIRVFVDYPYQQVEFFNVETKTTIFLFSNASFSGERIYPWFRVWDGTELTLHP